MTETAHIALSVLSYIPLPSGGRHGANIDGWQAALLGVAGLLLLWWFVRKSKRDDRKYEALLSAEAEAEAALLVAGPDTGGRGFTPADLRGVAGPSQPQVPADAWLLGLAAVEAEDYSLDHGSWTLAPEPRDDAWQRKLDQIIESRDAASRETWQRELTDLQNALTQIDGKSHAELAVWVSFTAFWVRLGCAAGHIRPDEARTLTRSTAVRLRGICHDWHEYAELLQTEISENLRGTVALLIQPGWPWHENTWP